MKKLILISVVFALVAGTAFAVDLGGTVNAKVDLLKGSTKDDSDILAGGGYPCARIDGAGEAGEGKFGGYVRLDFDDGKTKWADANAWWKPIDQFKLTIGGFNDGVWGKEGVTGWMFNQKANDGIASNYGIWFGSGWGSSLYNGGSDGLGPLHNRYTFFEGFNEQGAYMEIKPMDMLGINIAIPFITKNDDKLEDIFKATIAQVDINLDFGNIAITFDGGGRAVNATGDAGGIFLYYGGSFGDLSLDVGFAYHFTDDDNIAVPPLGIGLGLKYASGAFGVKFRATAALGGDKMYQDLTFVNASINPYYSFSDSVTAFLNAGLGMVAGKDDTAVGFYVNPYLRVGAEWGPTFYFGIQLESQLAVDGKIFAGNDRGKDSFLTFSVPVAVMVSF